LYWPIFAYKKTFKGLNVAEIGVISFLLKGDLFHYKNDSKIYDNL
jgi:hypothetical protein